MVTKKVYISSTILLCKHRAYIAAQKTII